MGQKWIITFYFFPFSRRFSVCQVLLFNRFYFNCKFANSLFDFVNTLTRQGSVYRNSLIKFEFEDLILIIKPYCHVSMWQKNWLSLFDGFHNDRWLRGSRAPTHETRVPRKKKMLKSISQNNRKTIILSSMYFLLFCFLFHFWSLALSFCALLKRSRWTNTFVSSG